MLLAVNELTKAYGNQPPVFSGLSFTVDAGETVAVVGPSGCGKSTLLNCIGGLDQPTAGTVTINDQVITTLNDAAKALCRATTIGFIFQDHHLLPQLSAEENVVLPTLALPTPPNDAEVRKLARDLLAQVGLAGKEHSRPAQLSGGERQRVALARALINKPKLILADEPTGALDQHTATAVSDVLLDLNKQAGTALIVVTHSPALAARMSRQIDFAARVAIA